VTVVWLPDETWDAIQASVPIVCVDLLPVRLDGDGAVSALGLIRRRMPGTDDIVWCVLGGRIDHGETLRDAVLRHVATTLSGTDVDLPADPQPSYVFQWFPSPRDDDGVAYGIDPRRHSVGLCFVLPVTADPEVVEGSEALNFKWFGVSEIEAVANQSWPGTVDVISAALRRAIL
jgi:ADP-ribose pyrophosphatase YjhB (NUDIX family)